MIKTNIIIINNKNYECNDTQNYNHIDKRKTVNNDDNYNDSNDCISEDDNNDNIINNNLLYCQWSITMVLN